MRTMKCVHAGVVDVRCVDMLGCDRYRGGGSGGLVVDHVVVVDGLCGVVSCCDVDVVIMVMYAVDGVCAIYVACHVACCIGVVIGCTAGAGVGW